jgi:hypothetical protein
MLKKHILRNFIFFRQSCSRRGANLVSTLAKSTLELEN